MTNFSIKKITKNGDDYFLVPTGGQAGQVLTMTNNGPARVSPSGGGSEDVIAYLKNHTFSSGSLNEGKAIKDGYVQFTFNKSDVSGCSINGVNVYTSMVYYASQTARSPIFRIYAGDTISGGNGRIIMYQDD